MTKQTNIIIPKKEEMTTNQKVLRKIIIELRQVLIGEQENMYNDLDPEKYIAQCPSENYTKSWAVEQIYSSIMNTNEKYVSSEISGLRIEAKHVRFMGEDFVRAMIEDRVDYDYHKNGWAFPNNYNGQSPKEKAISDLKSHKYYHFNNGARQRWFEIVKVMDTKVKMIELPQNQVHFYKLEGDVLKEMIDDQTGECVDTYGGK